MSHDADVPELLPVLSRGKHRNPRKGACFMELVSFLAGERWSDHPACTHPLLAAVARLVNDYTSDGGRYRLAGMIPSVIGLTTDDPRADARIALGTATVALPVAAADRQGALAVSVRVAEQVLAELDGRPVGELGERSRWALDQAPHAARWAQRLTPRFRVTVKGFRRHAALSTVRCATEGVARACVPDPDALLYDLLVGAIDDTAGSVDRDTGQGAALDAAVDDRAWASACQLTGVGR